LIIYIEQRLRDPSRGGVGSGSPESWFEIDNTTKSEKELAMFRQWETRDLAIWAGWTASIAIGYTISLQTFLGIALASTTPKTTLLPASVGDFLFLMFIHAAIWGIVSAFQGRVLNKYIHWKTWERQWWIVTGMLGWMGFWLLLYAYPNPPVFPKTIPIGALGIGTLQWLTLHRYLSAVGFWGIGCWLLAHIGAAILISEIIYLRDLPFVLYLPGIIYGASTGFTLVFLFQKARQRNIAQC
jgi:hypothetical protein